jgi:geranylgeranyl pyrophosphate synthase
MMNFALLAEALKTTAIVELLTSANMDPATIWTKSDTDLRRRIREDLEFIKSLKRKMPSIASIKKRIEKYFDLRIEVIKDERDEVLTFIK